MVFHPAGNLSFASSSEIDGTIMQSSPSFQLTGVATLYFASQLQRIDHAKQLVKVTACAHAG